MKRKKPPAVLETRGQAKTILARMRPAFRKHVQPHTRNRQGERLGGGSILNARWNHRLSRDLDVYVRLDTTEDGRRVLDQAASACGGYRIEHPQFRRIEFTRNEDNHVDVSFETPTPKGGEERAIVDNQPAWVLSTAQIMSGKLQGRGMTSPARDLFDIAVCNEADPEALEIAVNGLSEQRLNAILNIYKETREQYADEAAELDGVPEALKPIRTNPTAYAHNAVLDRKYERLVIRTNNGIAEIETRTRTGSRTRTYEDAIVLQNGMEQEGINLFLKAQERNHEAVLHATVDGLWTKHKATVIDIQPEPLQHERIPVAPISWKPPDRGTQPGPKTWPAIGDVPPNPATPPKPAKDAYAEQHRRHDRNGRVR